MVGVKNYNWRKRPLKFCIMHGIRYINIVCIAFKFGTQLCYHSAMIEGKGLLQTFLKLWHIILISVTTNQLHETTVMTVK